PAGLNCLASGSLVKNITGTGDTVSYKFSSPGTKGISLVTGNFKLTKKLDSRIPLHIHTFESFRYPRRLKLEEVKEAFDFFIDRFGTLNLSAVNVLLKRGRVEGGVSNTGFITVHLPPDRVQAAASKSIRSLDASIDKTILSPILIRNRTEDHIIHELAHQWWGGVISWKSYRDVWLTEGLAHFSVLYYLKQKLSQREFNRIIKKLRRWVYRFDEAGPIIYGTRINLLEDKYEAYQSVIYNKSALVFLMLMDMIGETEFTRRLRSVVEK
ncbi:MAG: M1 family metallopeptidase, partial [bacterium]|nr:M1 family metallopeptidase [bacterium]